MRFLCALAFIAFLLSLPLAHANEIVVAENTLSGDEIALQDGRTLRLKGIKAASPEAKGFLNSAVSGRTLQLQDAETDRYGRVTATAFIQDERQSVEEALLREGMAFVYSAAGGESIDLWQAPERTAQIERRGFWADHHDVPTREAATLYGKYGFVSGLVSKAERVKNKAYLTFGASEHPDFTIIIAARHLRPLKKQGIDVLLLEGKTVRVRGWVTQVLGPTITITDPHQLGLAE
jgi:endonuclease YncB( thermonuclease family)